MDTQNQNEKEILINYARKLQEVFESGKPYKAMLKKIEFSNSESEASIIYLSYIRSRPDDPLSIKNQTTEIIFRIRKMSKILEKLGVDFPKPENKVKSLCKKETICQQKTKLAHQSYTPQEKLMISIRADV